MNEEIYNRHSMTLVKDVIPIADLKLLINGFMIDSSINMGSDFNDNTLERVIQIVQERYRYVPVYVIASGFKKGSMGLYGEGRLIPRNIGAWLMQSSQGYNRELAHKVTEAKDYSSAFDLNDCPVGSAICLKVDWHKKGLITINNLIPVDEWDSIPLKEMAERIKKGEVCVPEIFGIERKEQ